MTCSKSLALSLALSQIGKEGGTNAVLCDVKPDSLHLPLFPLYLTKTGCQGLEECHQWLSWVFYIVAKNCGDSGTFLGLREHQGDSVMMLRAISRW